MSDDIQVVVQVDPPTTVVVRDTADYGNILERVEQLESGTLGFEHIQSTPQSIWTISHVFGRRPNVQIYVAGKVIFTDVSSTTTQVTVTFPTPIAGIAVLT